MTAPDRDLPGRARGLLVRSSWRQGSAPPVEVITFGTIRGQFNRALVRDNGVVNSADSLEEVCARSVIEMVAPEGDPVQDHECLLRAAMLGNRDCPIQLHY